MEGRGGKKRKRGRGKESESLVKRQEGRGREGRRDRTIIVWIKDFRRNR